MGRSRWSVAFHALIALGVALGCQGSPRSSSSSNWLACSHDADCASVPGAICVAGVCQDSNGAPVSGPPLGAAGSAGASALPPDPSCAAASSSEWSPIASVNAPSPRRIAWTIPTESGMIVLGGYTAASGGGAVAPSIDDGAIYDLCTNAWRPIATDGMPTALADPTGQPIPVGTWTGKQLIVWGGALVGPVFTGYLEGMSVLAASSYDAIGDRWSAMNRENEPLARDDAVRVWTGERLLVWGGTAQSGDRTWANHDDGALFDPVANRWTPMSLDGAPSGRDPLGQYVWTGSKLVIWGGTRLDTGGGLDPMYTPLSDGAMYDVASDRWTALPSAGAPLSSYVTVRWTGKKMIVLGKLDGYTTPGTIDFDGAAFDPATNAWSPISPPPLALAQGLENSEQQVFWTGSALVVFGVKPLNGEAALLYDPESDTWSGASPLGTLPLPNWRYSAVIDGAIVVAGAGPSSSDARGAPHASTAFWRFDAKSKSWTALPVIQNRTGAAIVPSAHQLLVWGGDDLFTDLDAPNPCAGAMTACDPNTPMTRNLLDDGVRLGL